MIRFLLLLFIFVNSSFAFESVPNLIIKGNVFDANQRINIQVKLKASAQDKMCMYFNTGIPRTYIFSGNTNTKPEQSFLISMPLMELLLDKVKRASGNVKIIPDDYTIKQFIGICRFTVQQLTIDFDSTISSEGTYVVIRNSFYTNGDYPSTYVFDVASGETHTMNFPFGLIEGKQTFQVNLK